MLSLHSSSTRSSISLCNKATTPALCLCVLTLQLIELKSGETYNGHLVNVDSWMNIHLREVICTSKVRGREAGGCTTRMHPLSVHLLAPLPLTIPCDSSSSRQEQAAPRAVAIPCCQHTSSHPAPSPRASIRQQRPNNSTPSPSTTGVKHYIASITTATILLQQAARRPHTRRSRCCRAAALFTPAVVLLPQCCCCRLHAVRTATASGACRRSSSAATPSSISGYLRR